MIKVLIADDQKLLRESLKTIIETDREIQVTGCASNGQEAFELCGKALPDVVLMDVRMPDCDGVEGTRLIKEKYAGVKIVMLTTFEDEKNMAEALESGADGYIFKDVTPEELIRVIKNAAEGFLVFSRKTERILLRSFTSREGGREGEDNRSRENTGRGPQTLLKPGEMEILQLIAEGKSNRVIAETVFLSEGRVKNIVSEILDKLGLKDRYELLSFAYKNHLIR